MALKFSELLDRVDHSTPNLTVDVELDGEEKPIVFRNIMRLLETEQKDIAEVFAAFGEDGMEKLTEEELESTYVKVMVERAVQALHHTADNKKRYDDFIDGLRASYPSDFNTIVIELFNAYAEGTKLGEAWNSESA